MLGGVWVGVDDFLESNLGFQIQLRPDQAWLYCASIDKTVRGGGLYTRLLAHVARDVLDRGYRELLVMIQPWNRASMHNHEKYACGRRGQVTVTRVGPICHVKTTGLTAARRWTRPAASDPDSCQPPGRWSLTRFNPGPKLPAADPCRLRHSPPRPLLRRDSTSALQIAGPGFMELGNLLHRHRLGGPEQAESDAASRIAGEPPRAFGVVRVLLLPSLIVADQPRGTAELFRVHLPRTTPQHTIVLRFRPLNHVGRIEIGLVLSTPNIRPRHTD